MSLNSDLSKLPSWVQWLIIVIFGATLFFVIKHIFDAGREFERSKWLLDKALQTVSNQVELAKKNRDLRVLENRLSTSAVEISTFHQGVMNAKLKEKDAALAAQRNGTNRLSIPVTGTATACQSANGGSPGNQPETVRETRAELTTEAAEFLIQYGAEFDEVIIESNQVKDLLTDCRAALQKQKLILGE